MYATKTRPITLLEDEVRRAEWLWREGDLAGALAIYLELARQRVLCVDPHVPFIETLTAADMVIIERLPDLSILFGQDQAADDLLAAMAVLNTRAGNVYGADYITLKRIHLALGRGNVRQAFGLLEEMASSIGDLRTIVFTPAGLRQWERTCQWPGTDRADRAVLFTCLYLVMGRLLAALGHYGDASAALKRGLAHTSRGDAPDLAQRAAVALRLALAGALLEQGALDAAQAQLKTLASSMNEQRAPGFYVRRQELYGKLNLLRGALGDACEHFWSVFDLNVERKFDRAALLAALNLAHTLIILNQTGAAWKLLCGVQARAQVSGETALAGRATFLLGVAYARGPSLAQHVVMAPSFRERISDTDDSSSQGRTTTVADPWDVPQSTSYLAFFEDRALAFHWYLGRQNGPEAARCLEAITHTFQDTDSDLIQLRIRILEATLAYYNGQWKEAEAMLHTVSPRLRRLGLIPDLWQVQRMLGWCAARLNRSGKVCQRLKDEATALLTGLTESLSGPACVLFSLNKWTADEEDLAVQIDQLVALKTQIEQARWFRRPALRWTLLKRLHALLGRIDRYKAAGAEQALGEHAAPESEQQRTSVWHRLMRHPAKRATLSFLVLPDRVFTIATRRFALDFVVSPVTRIQLRDLIRAWHELTSGPRNTRELRRWVGGALVSYTDEEAKRKTEREKTAAHLAERLHLFDLLEALPRRIRTLTIVPDDSLHGFPFAAVRYRDKYLIEHFALSIAFQTQPRPASPQTAGRTETLLVGLSRRIGRYGPLSGVFHELDQIQHRLGRREDHFHRLDDQAGMPVTWEVVLDRLKQARLFHLACHGTFAPDRPGQSGMVLATRSGRPEVLGLRELAQMNLAGLEHVTLSSCWAADNFVLSGRRIIGVPETLWRAGAQSVLGCLWRVYDDVAVILMDRFYEHLKTLPRDQALQRTQVEWLAGTLAQHTGRRIEDPANPLFWAGFTLYGEGGPLPL